MVSHFKTLAIILPLLLLAGCWSTSHRMNSLSVGMPRPQVIQAMGEPDTSSAQGSWEILGYYLTDPSESWSLWGDSREYQVRLWKGKVQSYGRR